ncbi:hypothetical protein DXG01_006728 [Tephrocybe rancida]|nr:hypothetical protein DXG01_006728 [Tephrocybe rancida]
MPRHGSWEHNGFNYELLYNFIVDYFEDVSGLVAKQQVSDLLTWWTRVCMALVLEDPALVQQIIQLLSKELNESRNRIQELTTTVATLLYTSSKRDTPQTGREQQTGSDHKAWMKALVQNKALLDAARKEVDDLKALGAISAQQKVDKEVQCAEHKEHDSTTEHVETVLRTVPSVRELDQSLHCDTGSNLGTSETRRGFKTANSHTNGIAASFEIAVAYDCAVHRLSKFLAEPRDHASSHFTKKTTPDASLRRFDMDQRRLKIFSAEFICLPPGLLRWGPDKVNAVAFGPFHVLSNTIWKEERTFAILHDQCLEVFFSTKEGVCYAGTYHCYHGRDWFPEGVQAPADISIETLLNTTVKSKSNMRNDVWPIYSKYRKGALRVDCMVLEFTGFDHDLYDKLCASNAGNVPKRPAKDQNGGAVHRPKKRKKVLEDSLSSARRLPAHIDKLASNNMRPIYEDPELAEQVIGLLNKELKESRATIRALTTGSNEDSDETQSSAVEMIVALNTKYTLAQNTLNETMASLEVAKQEIDGLQEKAKLVRSEEQLQQTKAELETATGRAEAAERTITSLEQMMTDIGDRVDRKFELNDDSDMPTSMHFWRKLRVAPQGGSIRKELLEPVCNRDGGWTMDGLQRHLNLSGLLWWGPQMTNITTFGPRHSIDDGKWKEERAFSKLHGRTLEVFFTKKAGLGYAGTYRGHHSDHWFPDGVEVPGHLSTKSLCNAHASNEVRSNGATLDQRWFMSKYKKGKLRADCMVLEYIGFDHHLYEKLCGNSVHKATKRPAEDEDNGLHREKRFKKRVHDILTLLAKYL